MASNTKGKSAHARNDARNNGKAWKQNPGVSPKAATGRTVGGYSPETIARRTAKRTKTPAK